MHFNIPAEYKKASGVYIIRNTLNNRVYVGSTANFWSRYGAHLRHIQGGKHHSRHLQAFVSKHGNGTLSFEIHELCLPKKESLLECEQKWLDYFINNKLPLFNCAPKAYSLLGIKRSEETKKRMSAAKKAAGISPEHRKKLSDGYRGRKNGPHSDETKRKLSEAAKRRSPELVAEQTARLLISRSPVVNKIKKPRKPRKPVPAKGTRAVSIREWWASRPIDERKQKPEAVAQREATKKANQAIKPRKGLSEEAKLKMSEQRKGMGLGRKWSPESIAKRTATLKANRLTATLTLQNQLTLFP